MNPEDRAFAVVMALLCVLLSLILGFAAFEVMAHPGTTTVIITQTP